MTHRARGCPFITNVDGEDFVIGGFAKYKGYGDECKTIYFVALFQDEENKENGNLVFPFCFEYSYDTDEYKCYSKHFSDGVSGSYRVFYLILRIPNRNPKIVIIFDAHIPIFTFFYSPKLVKIRKSCDKSEVFSRK